MNRIGGVEEPILPGVVLLATGVVDGLLAEERGDILPDAPQDASESVMRLHRRFLPRKRWLVPSTSTRGDPKAFAGFAVTGIFTGICVDNSMPFGTLLILRGEAWLFKARHAENSAIDRSWDDLPRP